MHITAQEPTFEILSPATNLGSLKMATDMLGGGWKFVILWQLLAGELTFDEVCSCIPDANPRVLHQQLQDLERDGLILRSIKPKVLAISEYSISSLGRTLEPIILALQDWVERYDGHSRTAGHQTDRVRMATGPGQHCGQAVIQLGTPGLRAQGPRA